MSKHTEGPWTVGCSMDERTSLTRGEYVVFPLPEDDEIEANARLIAAAPDLPAALVAARENVTDEWLGIEQYGQLINQIDAAISAAGGE